MDLLDRAAPAPIVAPPGLAIVPLHGGRWRVTRVDGSVLGYLERDGEGYRSLRMLGRDPRLVVMAAECWSAADALAALR